MPMVVQKPACFVCLCVCVRAIQGGADGRFFSDDCLEDCPRLDTLRWESGHGFPFTKRPVQVFHVGSVILAKAFLYSLQCYTQGME